MLIRLSRSPVSLTLRFVIVALAVHGALDLASGVLAQEEHKAYMPVAQQPRSLAERVADLEYKLANVVASSDAITVTGANLWVVNATGTTDGEPNGLGNVIVGYNEMRGNPTDHRSGSHMLVVGSENSYSSFGGIVVGHANFTSGKYASVSGGHANAATADSASVSGGVWNLAENTYASVSGGMSNLASGAYSSVSGGSMNVASLWVASVSGGMGNRASGAHSSVSGGSGNIASGESSAVSGGQNRTAPGDYNWAAGSRLEER